MPTYPAPGVCPVCGGEMYVERLRCHACDTGVEGRFVLPRLAKLSREDQEFVEIFLRAEGKLNRVQEILNISYPTARARLHKVIRALGYEAEPTPLPRLTPEERQAILDDLAAKRITVDEALARLEGRT